MAVREDGPNLSHRRIHHVPEILIPLRCGERNDSPPNAVFIGARVEIDAARMRSRIIDISGGHLADSANGDRHLRVVGRSQLVEEVDLRNLPEQLILRTKR